MKYFFIAGERSGDQHAAAVIKEVKAVDIHASVVGWGGSFMKEAGAEILYDYSHFSVMGFWEVLKNLFSLMSLLDSCKRDISNENPDVLILVDFPGFNLRIARFAHRLGIKTCYFISPKVWAWNKGRVRQIKNNVDLMLSIFPFEKEFYEYYNYPVKYVGNPVIEEINRYKFDKEWIQSQTGFQRKVAILPGSREGEVKSMMSVVEQLISTSTDCQFLVAGVDNLDRSLYRCLEQYENVSIHFNKTYDVLKAADIAVVTSGTATLETALLGVPQVVVYKTSWLTYWVAGMLIRLEFISLVNILAGKKVVTELIQSDYNSGRLKEELKSLFQMDTKKRISEGYSEIRTVLGEEKASRNAAQSIYELGSP